VHLLEGERWSKASAGIPSNRNESRIEIFLSSQQRKYTSKMARTGADYVSRDPFNINVMEVLADQ